MRFACSSVVSLLLAAGPVAAQAVDGGLRGEAIETLKKAATYYRNEVARRGGYVYYTSLDLRNRWGEGEVDAETIFVQPPGTPTVGMAFLSTYAATEDSFYLEVAREAAMALVHGQLESGGWAQVIHFARPERGRLGKYRKGKPAGGWNVTSLDDGQTQAALEFLVRVDETLAFKNVAIHDAAMYGLDALLKAQFANGAFPQAVRGPATPQSVRRARYPDDDWRTERRVKNYWDYYTLNDGLAGTVAQTLIAAHEVYSEEKYQAALEKLGDFLVLAQMPSPQPGWCQQYDYEMYPIWARKFEPPAIAGAESQDVMETLLQIALYTGETKYLKPIPPALKYFEECLLPGGQMARYYELRTNKPLYMDQHYRLTYDDAAAPSHYGWKQPARFAEIEAAYRAVKQGRIMEQIDSVDVLAEDAVRIIRALDDAGRWVTTHAGERLVGQPKFARGFRYLSSEVFSRNVERLSEYVAASGE